MKTAAVKSKKQYESRAAAHSIFQLKRKEKDALRLEDNRYRPAALHRTTAPNRPGRATGLQRFKPPPALMPNVETRPQRQPQRRQGPKQPIQRLILGESGFAKTLKLAEKQGRFDFSLGFTPPTVNFSQIAKASDVVDAFKGKDQLVEVTEKGENDFTANVDTVPRNNAGYMMYLPEPGPWIKNVSKKNVLAILNVEDNGRNPKDVIRLEITGPNGHEELEKQVEKHEKVHAKDNERIRDQILKPWDAKLMTLEKNKQTFAGESAEEATEKLWANAGGSLEEKAAEVTDAWGKASDAFHRHKKGKTRMYDKGCGINSDQTRAVFSYYLTI